MEGLLLNAVKKGFSLLELFIAIIVVALLAALTIPLFIKNMEKSKTGEVIVNLNLIRMAEKDYFIDNVIFTATIGNLNIEDPNNTTNKYFSYAILSADAADFTARATRNAGPYSGDYYEISKDGAINCANGHFQL
ncbi:MAG: type II secretion system protein [Candidatus Omnitrophota bacterium]